MPIRRRQRRSRRLRAFAHWVDEDAGRERGADRPRRHGRNVAVERPETGE